MDDKNALITAITEVGDFKTENIASFRLGKYDHNKIYPIKVILNPPGDALILRVK